MTDNAEKKQRAILVAVDTGAYDADISLEELKELADSAGAQVLAAVVQKRQELNPATAVGKGFLSKIKEQAKALDADLLIFDNILSPGQLHNIQSATDLAVIDRTALILDIFAKRAQTHEGKLQVELAQQKYRMSLLAGQGQVLSRLGGGIGTRGPGESKLELDRRAIRRRVVVLEKRLEEMKKQRDTRKSRRVKEGVNVVSLIGYTNVGKSTLFNALTGADVCSRDMLFATLDPTARGLELEDGRRVVLTDTVGLVRRLPHQLVEAFHSTLEEVATADLLLLVCDISSGEVRDQIDVTRGLLEELGCQNTPVITVYNKCDRLEQLPSLSEEDQILVSAKTGFGLDKLMWLICKKLPCVRFRMRLVLPYSQTSFLEKIWREGEVCRQEYTYGGVEMEILADCRLAKDLENFRVQ